ncbi:polysaccharide deacetylase family protein [Salinimicrobium sp. GXAS 041]|uniref:polysaccharide deacetylase family protein n=1 Tax=Salinimicrobium sp. GXAS 041 TaxID=3400806 RepID=UPI003C78E276
MKSSMYKVLNKVDAIMESNSDDFLRVLAYHTVPDEAAFENQLKYLVKNYDIIGISDLQDHLFHFKKLPKKPLLITFDDGDISVYKKGLPLLDKYHLPSVLFVITALIDSENMFWWKQVEKVFQEDGYSYADARKKISELKLKPNEKRINYLNELPHLQTRQLTTTELIEMQRKQMFIANHTYTHPMVDRCTESEIRIELKNTRKKFKEWNLRGYPIFAYPNGNWNEKTEKILYEEGIEMAFLFDHKLNAKKINPMRISRLRVDSNLEINEFTAKVSGLHSKLMFFKQHYLGLK